MNRKILLILISLLLAATLIFSQRAKLSTMLMENVAEQRLTENVLTGLVDGLHVVLCGAGGPLADPKRSGPCVAVIAGDTIVMVDAGSGSARNLTTLQIPVGEIFTLFLTHYHSDHIDGLGELAMMRWVNAANTTPLPVVGPTGLPNIVDGFNQAYALDARYRHAHHSDLVAPLSGRGMLAYEIPTPLDGQQVPVLRKDGLVVTMFAVDHAPVVPAVGYRFDYKGRSVVISGDTSKSANLQSIAQGADLLVHEALASKLVATMNRAAGKADNAILQKITVDIPDYHTTPVEAAEIAAEAGVGHLLYYHVVPALPLPGMQAAFLEGVPDAYNGPVTVGVDGTMISLPADSRAIESNNLL